jgi:hypothetical protein
MLRSGGCVAERVESDERDGFAVTWLGRCVDAERCSCILPFSAERGPLSLPLPVCLLLLVVALRSSVTLGELTSFRSSLSVVVCEAVPEEMKLR